MYILIYKIDILLDFDFDSKFFRLYIYNGQLFFYEQLENKKFYYKKVERY